MTDSTPVQYKHPQVINWNINDDFYKDGMRLYADGLLEINIGGTVYTKSLRKWFDDAKELEKWRDLATRVMSKDSPTL